MPVLEERGYFKPRGVNGEHPSMFDTTMKMQRVLYELEINGLPTDRAQLDMLTEKYQAARADLLAKVLAAAAAPPANFPEFNPRSSDDIRELLFNRLKLKPVKTTDGDSWDETLMGLGMDDEDAEDIRAATDKTTLEILDDPVKQPIVHMLLQFKRIDQSCKTWLRRTDDKGQPAGLYKQLWSDGNLHPRFSPLTATGRLRSSSPNCQNFPKQAEAYVSDIFGKGNEPPLLRTIIKPKDGWVMIEGDYKQAELFTLANLSQDENMLKALTTPGIDLHDKTAVESFGLRMFDESGNEVSEEYLVELAAKLGGTENDEYEHFMKTLVYVDAHGAKLSRSSFKNSLRVASKGINFGIALRTIVRLKPSELQETLSKTTCSQAA